MLNLYLLLPTPFLEQSLGWYHLSPGISLGSHGHGDRLVDLPDHPTRPLPSLLAAFLAFWLPPLASNPYALTLHSGLTHASRPFPCLLSLAYYLPSLPLFWPNPMDPRSPHFPLGPHPHALAPGLPPPLPLPLLPQGSWLYYPLGPHEK